MTSSAMSPIVMRRRSSERDLDAEALLEIHDEFERHQRVEPDFAERTYPADVFLARCRTWASCALMTSATLRRAASTPSLARALADRCCRPRLSGHLPG